MPRVMTKYTFKVEEIDTKEKLSDALTKFAEYVESTYARIQVSHPLEEMNITANTVIQLNPNSDRIVVVVKTNTGSALVLDLIDNKDNLCRIGTLVELKLRCTATVTVNLTIPPSTTLTDSRGSGYHSRYYFKTSSGWINLAS
jgi:hypothetical protein